MVAPISGTRVTVRTPLESELGEGTVPRQARATPPYLFAFDVMREARTRRPQSRHCV